MATLPQGFKLDPAPSEAVALPEGFKLDVAPTEAPATDGWLLNSFKRGTANALASWFGFQQGYGQMTAEQGVNLSDATMAGITRRDPAAARVVQDPLTGDKLRKDVETGTSLLDYRKYKAEAEKYPATVPSFKDVNSLDTAVRYVGERIAENIPNMAASIGTMGMAAVPLSVGEVQGNLIDKGVTGRPELAAVAGLPAAALEMVTPLTVANKILASVGMSPTGMLAKAASRGVIGRTVAGAAEGFVKEGVTEGLQEGLSLGAETAAGVPPAPGEAMSRVLESVIGGGVAGGGITAMVSVLPPAGELPPPTDPTVEGIKQGLPPAPPTPEQTPLFMEDAEPATPAAPGQPAVASPATEAIPLDTDAVLSPAAEQPQPIKINTIPANQDTQTYGDFTKSFVEGKSGETTNWVQKNGTASIVSTPDNQYQVDIGALDKALTWVFPTLEQAAWVGENARNLTPKQFQGIQSSMSPDQVTQYIYEQGKPKQAFFVGLDGQRIRVENSDSESQNKTNGLTFQQLDAIRSNPRMMQYVSAAAKTGEMIREELLARGYEVASSLSYSFFPEKSSPYGYNSTVKGVVVNLANDIFRQRTADGTAVSVVNTIIHELAHDFVRSHDVRFANLHNRMTDDLLDRFAARAMATEELFREENIPYLGGIHAIRKALGDPAAPSQLDPRLRQALFPNAERTGSPANGGERTGVDPGKQLAEGREAGAPEKGGNRPRVEPIESGPAGSEFAPQPVWSDVFGRAVFGPNGVFADGASVPTADLVRIANEPELFGLRKEEVEITGLRELIKTKGASGSVSAQDLLNWLDSHKDTILRDVPPESRIAGAHIARGLKLSEAVQDTIDKENMSDTLGYLDRFGWLRKHMSTVLQLAYENKHIPTLQNFVQLMRDMSAEKNSWKYKGEQILKDWQRLGKTHSNNLTNFLFEATAKSDELGRRLTVEELADLSKEHKLTADAEVVFGQIDSLFQNVLGELKREELNRVRATTSDPVALAAMEGQIENEFNALLNRNYFPYTRFGNHVLFVRAKADVEYQGKLYKKGQTMHLSTYSSRRERDAVYKEFRGRFSGVPDAEIGTRTLKEEVATFTGMPPGMLKKMEEFLKLDPEQKELAEMLINSYRPSRSFVQHMRKRRGIGGFSYDGQRVFSSYLQSAAGHIARIKYKDELKNQVEQTRASTSQVVSQYGQGALRDDIANAMDGYLEAALHPREDLGALKSLVFFSYFGFVPVQAFVNVMQLPMMTYPHLAKKYGPVKAAQALVKAMKDTSAMFSFSGSPNWTKWNLEKRNPALTNAQRKSIAYGIERGLLDESFAVEVAQLANGNLLESLLPYEIKNKVGEESIRNATAIVREISNLGLAPFKLSEEWNRRVAWLAAFNLETETTQNEHSAYAEAQETIEQTMYEYQAWNRVPLARAFEHKASLLFLFKTFQQNSLWYYARGRGGIGALAMLATMAGLEGLPFAEDLIEIMNTAFSTGGKKFDVRKELRTFLSELMDDPDTVMHGISRHSFGLGYLQNVPDWDFSHKLGQGRVIPSVAPVSQKLRGEIKTDQMMVRFIEEWSGVAGGYGMNAVRAMTDMGPEGAKWRSMFMPSAARNITRTVQAVNDEGTITDYKGSPLVKFDQTDPTQMLEMYGQLMGLRPTRLAQAQEKLYLMSQEAAFYTARKGHLMTQLEQAFVQGTDKEAQAAAMREVKHYNETSPPEMRLTADGMMQSLRTRAKNNALKARGLPTQASWQRLHQEWNKAFPSQ